MKQFALSLLFGSMLVATSAITVNAADVVILECVTPSAGIPGQPPPDYIVSACSQTATGFCKLFRDLCAPTVQSILGTSGAKLESTVARTGGDVAGVSGTAPSGVIYTFIIGP
jgi:hypothetical protein